MEGGREGGKEGGRRGGEMSSNSPASPVRSSMGGWFGRKK